MDHTKQDQPIDYKVRFIRKPKWIIVFCLIFMLSLFSYFSPFEIIDNKIYSSLKSIPGCPIEMKDYQLKLFFPRIEANQLKIPMSCLSRRGDALIIPKITLFFRGLSFSPFGASFKVETNIDQTKLNFSVVTGFSDITVLLKENIVELEILKKFIETAKLSGDIKLDLFLKMSDMSVVDLNLNARSKNLMIPAQNISGVALPNMPINNFLLQVNTPTQKKLVIQEFVLGDVDAPIRAKFTGDAQLNQKSPMSSLLNVSGEVAFSDKFLEDYSIIKILMQKFDKKDNFYQIQIKGPLQNPQTSSPKR